MNVHERQLSPFDVDGTLVCNPKPDDPEDAVYVDIPDPYSYESLAVRQRINKAMVRLLKEEHHRGGHVIVWSRRGHAWARNVVVALGLMQYVNDVFDKPRAYFDDVEVQNWLKDRVFIGPNETYAEGKKVLDK